MLGHPKAVGFSNFFAKATRKGYPKADNWVVWVWSLLVCPSHLFYDSLYLLIMSLLLVSSFPNRDIHRQILRIVCVIVCIGQLCELCSALLSLAKAGSCCTCMLGSSESLPRCWETQGRAVLVQGLCCIQQQAGEPREKMKMGNHGQISRQGRSLLCSVMEMRRVHASLRGQKMMLNQPRQAFSG